MFPRHHHSTTAHWLSILFALLGLVCAGAATTLILKLVVAPPLPPIATVTVDYYDVYQEDIGDSLLLLSEETEDTIDWEELAVGMRMVDSSDSVPSTTQQQLLRGRRLAEIVNGDTMVSSPPPTMTPSSVLSEAPSAETIIHLDQDPAKELTSTTPSTADADDSSTVQATETTFAVVAGLAGSIVVCSLLLYGSDIRDRYLHEKWMRTQQLQDNANMLTDDNSSQKSSCLRRGDEDQSMTTTSAASSAESGYYIHARVSHELVEYRGGGQEHNILPPMITDGKALVGEDYEETALKALEAEPLDDVSISRVSTLTTSLVEGGYGGYTSYADIQEKMGRYAIESSSEVTELSDNYRVGDGADLTTLVAKAAVKESGFPSDEEQSVDASVCSSLTNGSNATTATPKLLGERCLERKGTSSLEVSPDTPQDDSKAPEERQDDDCKPHLLRPRHVKEDDEELSQLEQLIAHSPFGNLFGTPTPQVNIAPTDDEKRDGSNNEKSAPTIGEDESFVRDIYFVPCTEGSPSLGLDLCDAIFLDAWARITFVDPASPLVGRVFVGDSILRVNDFDAIGRSGKYVLELMKSTHAHVDGIDESSLAGSNLTKLTVMSMESDGGSLSDGQQSLDLGQPESGVEL